MTMQSVEPAFIIGIVVVILIVAVTTVFPLTRKGDWKERGNSPISATLHERADFLSSAERSFFGVLHATVASEYQIFAKVRLADIIRPVKSTSRSGWQSAFNRLTGKHVDFVLCDADSLSVVGVIELDDRTHQQFERGVRDSFVDSALSQAGIPVLRIVARYSYSPMEIREQITKVIGSRRRSATLSARE